MMIDADIIFFIFTVFALAKLFKVEGEISDIAR